jgi:CheY-like chemotaxis protein
MILTQNHKGFIWVCTVQMPVIDGLKATRFISKNLVEKPSYVAMTANACRG